MFYLHRIPSGSTKIVDLKDEVVLCSIQPLHSDTLIRHPSYTGQVVLTAGKKRTANQDTRWLLCGASCQSRI